MDFMYGHIVLFWYLHQSRTWRSFLVLGLRLVLDMILLLQPVGVILALFPLKIHLLEVIMPAPGVLPGSFVLGGGMQSVTSVVVSVALQSLAVCCVHRVGVTRLRS